MQVNHKEKGKQCFPASLSSLLSEKIYLLYPIDKAESLCYVRVYIYIIYSFK